MTTDYRLQTTDYKTPAKRKMYEIILAFVGLKGGVRETGT
jgi:hypothetical protein